MRCAGTFDPQFCPRPDSKHKTAEDFVRALESKRVLTVQHRASLHYAIGHLHRLEVLTLAELHVSVLTSFFKFNKALIKFNEALTKLYSLIEILLLNFN